MKPNLFRLPAVLFTIRPFRPLSLPLLIQCNRAGKFENNVSYFIPIVYFPLSHFRVYATPSFLAVRFHPLKKDTEKSSETTKKTC